MRRNIVDTIREGKILLADGAWGTMLHEMGLQPGECPELWNIDRREKILGIARSYVLAGADIIGTNSFGASSVKLALYGLESRAQEINTEAARISREAAGESFVLGTIGPSGKLLMMGDVSPEELQRSFAEQAIALQAGGVDGLIIETMTATDEALLAIRAAKENTDLPVAVSFTFDRTVDNEYRTMMGLSPTEVCTSMATAGVDIMGTNCGNGMLGIVEICQELRANNNEIPLMAQANAGIPEYRDGRNLFPEGADMMASHIDSLVQAGVSIIGGCCGTGPDHIAQFATKIWNINRDKHGQ